MKNARMLCAVAIALCAASPSCLAGEMRIEVHGETYAPAKLWVAPVATEKDVKTWIEIAPSGIQHRRYRAEYRATLAPGRYALVAADVAKDVSEYAYGALYGIPSTLPVPFPTTTPVRTLRPDAAQFEIGNDARDLGRIEFLTGSGLALLVRNAGATGWITADPGDGRDPDVARLRAKLRWISTPREMPDGRWLALASGNRMIVRDNDGRWRAQTVMQGGVPRIISAVSADTVAIAAEGPRIEWRRLDGTAAESFGTTGLAEGLIEALHCDADRRCAAAVLTESSIALHYTADASKGGWTQAAVLGKVQCNSICMFNATFHSLPGEMLAIGDKGSTVRVRLSDGAVERGTLPFRHTVSFYNNAKLTARDKISADGGRSWQEINTRAMGGTAQFDQSGHVFELSLNFEIGFNRPAIRYSDDGGQHWREISQPPTFGTYVVGGISPAQYMHYGNNLWVSLDAGLTWQIDHAAFEALAHDGGTP